MLKYVSKYRTMYFVLCPIIAIALITAASAITGGATFTTIPGILVSACIVAVTYVVGWRIVDKAATAFAEKDVALFNDDCDPEAFIEAAQGFIPTMQKPYDRWSAWYLSPYALALIDAGRTPDAQQIVDNMHDSLGQTTDPATLTALYVNLYPPVKELYSRDLATWCLDQAEQSIANAPEPKKAEDAKKQAENRQYLSWARRLAAAEDANNDSYLLQLHQSVVANDVNPQRARVQSALAAADCAKHLGDAEEERRFLEYVIQHGNKLKAVQAAKEQLEELDTPAAPSEPLLSGQDFS